MVCGAIWFVLCVVDGGSVFGVVVVGVCRVVFPGVCCVVVVCVVCVSSLCLFFRGFS